MPAQLHALHTARALDDQPEKPLPQLPSPTLTNPEYILPSAPFSSLPSPPRFSKRPPSPSYLRDDDEDEEPPMPSFASRTATATMPEERDRIGLMSRKMMLIRGKTGSNSNSRLGTSQKSPNSHAQADLVPSSPVLQDVGNLAPERTEFLQPPEPDHRRTSGGSSSSDLSRLSSFLDRYTALDGNGTSDDEALLYDSSDYPTPSRLEGSMDVDDDDDGVDAQRRRKEQEELNSAILSKRAEQILANAKKRLNVMEGNLRGARDLVVPLTSANLKRATSVGSGHYSAVYGNGRTLGYAYARDDERTQSSPRKLHTQQSSPNIGNDFQNHSRGWSETLPERSYTALDNHQQHGPSSNVRMAPRRIEQASGRDLRSSKSHDSLGLYKAGRDHPLHNLQSIDPNQLEPLREDDERRSYVNGNNGLGIYRPSSRTSDIRDQMSTLKTKISSLKERAREDSLRRQSQLDLRQTSLFNNARATPPELFYTASEQYGSPVLDTNAGVGWSPNQSSPVAAQQGAWETGVPITGSRNAFAEQAAVQQHPQIQQARMVTIRQPKTAERQESPPKAQQSPKLQTHRRTASGTAVVDSAKNRYSHHQATNSESSQGSAQHLDAAAEDEGFLAMPSPGLSSHQYESSSSSSATPSPHIPQREYEPSEAESMSVYEDAKEDMIAPVVAHEDREDAFDYETFFLHSAMGGFNGTRRYSTSSEATVSSASTARGPTVGREDGDTAFDHSSAQYPPPTPETPERLREIERNLHKRSISDDSIATLDTFATAAEDTPISPVDEQDAYGQVFANQPRTVSPLEAPASRSQSRREYTRNQSRQEYSQNNSPRQDFDRSNSHRDQSHSHSRQSPSRNQSRQEIERKQSRPDYRRNESRQNSDCGHARQDSQSTQSTASTSRPIENPRVASRPGTALPRPVTRRNSSSDRADSGVGLTGRSQDGKRPSPQSGFQKHAGKLSNGSAVVTPPTSPREKAAKLDPATIAVQALLDPTGQPLGLRNKAVLFGVVESLRRVVRQMQQEEESTFASRMLRNQLDEAKRTLDGL